MIRIHLICSWLSSFLFLMASTNSINIEYNISTGTYQYVIADVSRNGLISYHTMRTFKTRCYAMVPDRQHNSLMRTQPERDAFNIFLLRSIKVYEYKTLKDLSVHRFYISYYACSCICFFIFPQLPL